MEEIPRSAGGREQEPPESHNVAHGWCQLQLGRNVKIAGKRKTSK